jgi:cysteinyl-tRNA synthetase
MAARYRSRSPHGGNEDIIPLILEREQARLNKDFASADAIRDRLTSIGVTVFDKTRSWKCNDGRSGRIPSWSEIEAGVGMESLAVEEGSAGNEDITQLVIEREQARLSKDFASADAIRDRLTAMGVTLFDKTNQWKSNDGRSGRIPTFTEIESGVGGENLAPGDNGGMGPINDSDDAMTAHIKGLVMQREQARAGKDFDRSDQLREELRSLGVEIFDKEKLWRAKTGQCGVVIGYSSTGVPTNVEITTLIAQREKARQNNDYAVGLSFCSVAT